MRLYSNVCIGLLVVFICQPERPAVVSDFCAQSAPDIAKLKRLTAEELAALGRPRKKAILSLRRNYHKQCEGR